MGGDAPDDLEARAETVRQASRGLTGQLPSDATVEGCAVRALVEQLARLGRPELRGI